MLLVGLAVLAAVIVLPAARYREMSHYGFVDTRTFLGIPNALDVLSNLPFALIGVAGFVRYRQLERSERAAWLVFFGALRSSHSGVRWKAKRLVIALRSPAERSGWREKR